MKSAASWRDCETERLEHPVLVSGALRYLLDHVPVLDNLPALQFEDVDNRRPALSRYAHSVHMHDDLVALGKDVLDLAT